jgi:hypothetical protein
MKGVRSGLCERRCEGRCGDQLILDPQICGMYVLAVESEQHKHTCYLSFSPVEHDRV